MASEHSSCYPHAAADALAGRIAAGDYYEALGVPPEAASREILAALMARRRQFASLDQEWNAIHTTLTQRRARYDAARALRDEIMDELPRRYDNAVCKRMTRQAIWQQLWPANEDEAPLLLRQARVMLQAQAWQRAEQSLAQARQTLSGEFGQGIWRLLDAHTNWQEVRRNLPDLPQALEAFARQLSTSGREAAKGLSEIEVTTQEAAQYRAERVLVHRQDCPTCHGRRQVEQSLQELWQERIAGAEGTLQELSKLVERYQRGLYSSPDMRATIPCPTCTRRVTFEVPSGAKPGWVLCGRDQKGEPHFARLARIARVEHTSPVKPDIETPPSRPVRLRDKVLATLFIIVYLAAFLLLLAVLVNWGWLRSTPASPASAGKLFIVLAIGLLLFWLNNRGKR